MLCSESSPNYLDNFGFKVCTLKVGGGSTLALALGSCSFETREEVGLRVLNKEEGDRLLFKVMEEEEEGGLRLLPDEFEGDCEGLNVAWLLLQNKKEPHPWIP